MNGSKRFTPDESSYSNDALSKGYGNDGESFKKTEDFKGFQGYFDNSGFEDYDGYKGPDPFYRGYHGNPGNNPTPAPTRQSIEEIPDRAAFMPDYSQLHTRPEDAFYKGYNEPQPMKYRPGMENEYQAPTVTSVNAVYDMPYYHFSAMSHLWSAGALFMMFVVSSGICLCPPLLPMNIDGFFMRLLISAVSITLYILSGYVAKKMALKTSDDVMAFFLLLYGGLSGIFVSIPLKCFFGNMLGVMSYSYLVGAVVIAGMAVVSLVLKYDLLNIPAMLISIGLSCMAEFAACHYLGTANADKYFLMLMTMVIMGFATFETITVRRSFDEYISDDNTMKRNIIIAALGHYVSFATLLMNMFKGLGTLAANMIPIILNMLSRNDGSR